MGNELVPSDLKNSQKTQVLLVGGVIGALTGVGAAYLILQARSKRSQEAGEVAPLVSSGSVFKIGILLIGLLRQVGEIARGE